MKIAFSRDKYGSKGRSSLVADFMEVCAWKYGRYQFDEIESFLRLMGRVRLRDDPFQDSFAFGAESADRESTDEIEEGADRESLAAELGETSDDDQLSVIRLVEERHSVLADGYPFRVTATGIERRDSRSIRAYDVLLAISIAQAFQVPFKGLHATIDQLFEEVAARCMERPGWFVHNLGKTGRRAASFDSALGEVSKAMNWPITTQGSVHKTKAQEEGCDTLVMLPWLDRRPGRLFMIGQAAVTVSDNWVEKISEPSPYAWAPRLQQHGAPSPIPLLLVSHHVETTHLVYLQKKANAIVVDRLRLVSGPMANRLTSDERNLVRTLRRLDIEV